jgi:hypothetical protein
MIHSSRAAIEGEEGLNVGSPLCGPLFHYPHFSTPRDMNQAYLHASLLRLLTVTGFTSATLTLTRSSGDIK